jgi:hypothetical protein
MQKKIKTKLKYEEIPIRIYPIFIDDRIISSITYEEIQEFRRLLDEAVAIPAAYTFAYEKEHLP